MEKLSIVVPCYNEEDGIPQLAEKLPPLIEQLQKEYVVELLFIDDGSTDKTQDLLRTFFGGFSYATIIPHEVNKNLGAALRTGFYHATGDYVAALDSDCTYDPFLLVEMLRVLNEKNVDIVTVSPYHPLGTVMNVPRYRLFLSSTVCAIYRFLLRSELHTFTAMVRVYRREVVKTIIIESNTFMGVTELLAKALLRGYKAAEIPATLNSRAFGISKMKTFRTIKDHLRLIWKIVKLKFGAAL